MNDKQEIIQGSVEFIKFVNEQNGYTVMDFACDENLLVVVGIFPGLNEGESLRIKGRFILHKDYGEQFAAEEYEYITPVDEESLIKYLSSGLFQGIGPATAQRMVDKFGTDTLAIMAEHPERLTEVKGINRSKADKISEAYMENFAYGQVMIYLQKFDIGGALALKIFKTYGPNTINIIEKDTYRLAEEVSGVGFKTVDGIAQKMGVGIDSIGRIRAAALYVLSLSVQSGNVFLPKETLYSEMERFLGIGQDKFPEALLKLAVAGQIRIENDTNIYLSYLYRYETSIANKLNILKDTKIQTVITDFDKRIRQFQEAEGVTLAENQVNAISAALAGSVTVITGGPGTGKTTIIKCIIKIFQDEGFEVVIAAPTGRAAKRITEATGYEASTVHRLLELQYSSDDSEFNFMRDAQNPLEADVIIVDEASMLDISITHHLLEAIKSGSRLILCGDVNQLPPVGAGKILKDIIECDKIKTVKLTEIYRQEAHSHIITNAHRINIGDMPYVNGKDSDFFMLAEENQENIVETIVDLCSDRLPKKYGLNALSDIQVLTPTRKGVCGVENLNVKLQERLNPSSKTRAEREVRGCIFREGDKVMQIKNNYTLRWEKSYNAGEEGEGLYNGDAGIVVHLNNEYRYMDVEFDDDRVSRYDFNQLEELEHAFAVTIHKSQGSEFPAVVIPVFYGPQMLLTRNLIYTAITRAKQLVVLVGSKKCLCDMIANTKETKRYTGLGGRL